ncbi:hypothetical protein ABPG75_011632 [Micractinium tetrahymenae]
MSSSGCTSGAAFGGPAPQLGATASTHSHDFFLSPADLARGLAFHGSGARARAAAARLLAGQPLHVAVAGGSVAWGQGAPGGAHFGRRFFDWVNATWPAPASAPHRFTNAAKPGITSALFALCGDGLIPQDADIVVLEFAFNDYYAGLNITGPERAAYERLVRRVLRFPSAPAVFSMHFFSYWYAKAKMKAPGQALFYNTGEDDLAVIAQFYDVPVLSLRNAAIHHMYSNDPGFRVDLMTPKKVPGTNLSDYFYWDDHHPYEHTGHRAMADLLVAAMQQAVREVQQGDAGPAAAGSPGAATSQHGQQQQKGQQQRRRERQRERPALPPPMFPGNYESDRAICRLGAAFKDVVVESSGFEYKAQRPQGATFVAQKWAWVGAATGAYAVLQLDTRLRGEASGSAQAAGLARVYLGHTRSWQQLGTASVECVAGCTCEAAAMDNHWGNKNTQNAMFPVEVTQHEQCQIRVTVDPPASTEEQPSTALTAVMVDSAGEADIDRKGNIGQWDMWH